MSESLVTLDPSSTAELARLESRVFARYGTDYDSSAWTMQQFAMELPDKFSFSVGYREHNRLLGFSVAYRYAGDWGHISRVAVDPDAQGTGIGMRMLQEQMRRMRIAGIERITVDVRAKNNAARRLYEKCGFRVLEGALLSEFVATRARCRDDYVSDSAEHFVYERRLDRNSHVPL